MSNNLQLYFQEMGKFEVFTPEEERECATKMAESFNSLVTEMLRVPFVWQHIFDRWEKVKARGRASNKLAEEYGNPSYNAEDLTVQVDMNIQEAMQLARGRAPGQYHLPEDSRIAFHLKLAGLSRTLYLDLVDEALLQPTLPPRQREIINWLRLETNYYRHSLVNANLRLVINFAKRFNGFGIDLPDLIQEGNIGLMRAAEKFDPGRQLKFSTYAAHWIRQSFIKALKRQSKTIRLPSHIYDTMNKVKHAHEKMYNEMKREPTTNELADRLELDPELLERLTNLRNEPLSLDGAMMSYPAESKVKYLKDHIADENQDTLETISSNRRDAEILSSIRQFLNQTEQEIIIKHFGLGDIPPHTLEQIANVLGKSRERVRQIENVAIKKLKKHATNLEEYYAE